jgi:glutamyl-tRNA reductase
VVLRIKPDESFESWANRVNEYEIDRARKRLAKGEDIDVVLEEMSKAVSQKLLHPILNIIRDSAGGSFDVEANKKSYNEYMKHIGPRADHIQEDK